MPAPFPYVITYLIPVEVTVDEDGDIESVRVDDTADPKFDSLYIQADGELTDREARIHGERVAAMEWPDWEFGTG